MLAGALGVLAVMAKGFGPCGPDSAIGKFVIRRYGRPHSRRSNCRCIVRLERPPGSPPKASIAFSKFAAQTEML